MDLNLIFPHRDFIICRVSLAIFQLHFSIRILSSAFCHPHFVIRILSSAFFYPPSAIRHPPSAVIRSALYRDPSSEYVLKMNETFVLRECSFHFRLRSSGFLFSKCQNKEPSIKPGTWNFPRNIPEHSGTSWSIV